MSTTILYILVTVLLVAVSIILFIDKICSKKDWKTKRMTLIIFWSISGFLLFIFLPFITKKNEIPYFGHQIPMVMSLIPVLTGFMYLSIRFLTDTKLILLEKWYFKIFTLILIFFINCGILFSIETNFSEMRIEEWKKRELIDYHKAIEEYWLEPGKVETVACRINSSEFVYIENEENRLIDIEMGFSVSYLGRGSYSLDVQWRYILRKNELKKFNFDPINNINDYKVGADLYSVRSNIFALPEKGNNIPNAECFVIPHFSWENHSPLSSVIITDIFLENGKKISFQKWLEDELIKIREKSNDKQS